jgi:hypothetical protein
MAERNNSFPPQAHGDGEDPFDALTHDLFSQGEVQSAEQEARREYIDQRLLAEMQEVVATHEDPGFSVDTVDDAVFAYRYFNADYASRHLVLLAESEDLALGPADYDALDMHYWQLDNPEPPDQEL